MKWKDLLNDAERERLSEMKGIRRLLNAEYRRIYDRCRKRLAKLKP
jgi:hypothetical protein